jgi:hypothetical protein
MGCHIDMIYSFTTFSAQSKKDVTMIRGECRTQRVFYDFSSSGVCEIEILYGGCSWDYRWCSVTRCFSTKKTTNGGGSVLKWSYWCRARYFVAGWSGSEDSDEGDEGILECRPELGYFHVGVAEVDDRAFQSCASISIL